MKKQFPIHLALNFRLEPDWTPTMKMAVVLQDREPNKWHCLLVSALAIYNYYRGRKASEDEMLLDSVDMNTTLLNLKQVKYLPSN